MFPAKFSKNTHFPAGVDTLLFEYSMPYLSVIIIYSLHVFIPFFTLPAAIIYYLHCFLYFICQPINSGFNLTSTLSQSSCCVYVSCYLSFSAETSQLQTVRIKPFTCIICKEWNVDNWTERLFHKLSYFRNKDSLLDVQRVMVLFLILDHFYDFYI